MEAIWHKYGKGEVFEMQFVEISSVLWPFQKAKNNIVNVWTEGYVGKSIFPHMYIRNRFKYIGNYIAILYLGYFSDVTNIHS